MAFDALALTAVRQELEPRLAGGQVQQLTWLDEMTLVLGLFAPGQGRTNLLLSAHPEHARVQWLSELPARAAPPPETPFVLLARKHLRGARLRAMHQPRLERLLELDLVGRDDRGQHVGTRLIVEVMGRRSNLILVDAGGTVLDALRRAPPSRNPRRPVLPHRRYEPPPPQDRCDPDAATAGWLKENARGRGGSLAAYLVDTLAGLSPLASRELAYRATGSAATPLAGVNWEELQSAIHVYFGPTRTGGWQPGVAYQDGAPVAYAPYAPTHLLAEGAEVRAFASMAEAMGAFFQPGDTGSGPRRGDPWAGERRPLLLALGRARAVADRRVASLERQQVADDEVERLRMAGETILAWQWQIGHGQRTLEVEGQEIALDEQLTAVENAQRYFARYRRARDAAKAVPALLERARQEAAHLANLEALVETADTLEALRALRGEVAVSTGMARAGGGRAARGVQPGRRATTGPSGPTGPFRRLPVGHGWEVLVGGSAAGNVAVTFGRATADDLWLHVRGQPGSHVVLPARGAEPTEAVVLRAAELAAWYSSARAAGVADVDVTKRRYVKKVPGGPAGLVRYTHERTVRVAARGPDEAPGVRNGQPDRR